MGGSGGITFVAGGMLVAAAWAVAAAGLPAAYLPLIQVLAEPLAVLLVVLAWRFRRSRLAVAAVVIGLANLLVRGPLEGAASPGSAALALLLPVNLGILVLTRDHPVPRLRTLLHLLATALQPPLVAAALYLGGRIPAVEHAPSGGLRLLAAPHAVLLVSLIAAVFGALAFAARRTTFEVAILWAVAAAAVAFTATRYLHESTIMFAAAQLVLLFALLEESYRLAYHDQLTGLPGRRALDERLRGLAGEYLIAMVDIDHFKRFNDRFGHEAGDQALRMLADELARVGGGGRAFRYGGEEFAVLFTGRSAPSAVEALEQLRVSVAARVFSIRSRTRPRKKPDKPVPPRAPSERVTLTVSIGAAISSGPGTKPDEVLRAADQALYRAKGKGRNRVEVTGGLGSPRARPRH